MITITVDDVVALGDEFEAVWQALGIVARSRGRQKREQASRAYLAALVALLTDGRLGDETRTALMNRIERLIATLEPTAPDLTPAETHELLTRYEGDRG